MNGEMGVTVAQQSTVLLWAVCAGFLMGLYYDFFRAIRLVIRCGKTAVMLQDIFFWVSSAAAIFFLSISVNNGYVRIYFILTALLAWGIYFFTIGNAVMFMVNIAAILLKRVAALVYRYVLRPFSRVTERFFMLISQKTTGLLSYITKNAKNHKKC